MGHLVAVQLPAPALAAEVTARREAGDAVAPLDPALPPARRAELLARLRPHRLVTPEGARDLADPAPCDDDLAWVIATSGSGGPPKLVELPEAAVEAATQASLARLGAQPGWRWACALPLHHVAGLLVLTRARACGTEPVLVDPGDAEALARALTGVEATALVPTQLRRLLDAAEAPAEEAEAPEAEADRAQAPARQALASLRALLLGGARADAGLLARARAHPAPVVTTYGMTETCGGVVYDGVPLQGVEATVDEAARIWLRGPTLLRRYRGDPTATAQTLREGWLATADAGRRDARGRLEVTGRLDDVIVTGGENVSGEAVREALRAAPGVADAAVVGLPDPEWGKRVAAVVEASGRVDPDPEALRSAVAARLGRRAAPRSVRVVATLPRTGLGKVDAVRAAELLTDPDHDAPSPTDHRGG